MNLKIAGNIWQRQNMKRTKNDELTKKTQAMVHSLERVLDNLKRKFPEREIDLCHELSE
jgi:hypothetical protein